MNTLQYIAKRLVTPGKGLLAADESPTTIHGRFEKRSIPDTEENRRKWRELLFTTAGIEEGLSGVILFDETIRQKTSGGVPFAKYLTGLGILPGIKVDQKTEPLSGSPEEQVTRGLDGLPERLAEYAKMGAQFTKWRAVIRIGKELPTRACLEENAKRIAQYAKESQQAGLVPIPEPEVLLDGNHSFARCEEVVTQTLQAVFASLKEAGVALPGLLLKKSMVLPGKESGEEVSTKEIAQTTVRALLASAPKYVAGIFFLSGGQTAEDATTRLNEIVKEGRRLRAPWPLTFSFSRALQDPVMTAWAGKGENVKAAQAVFAKRVADTASAARGEYHG